MPGSFLINLGISINHKLFFMLVSQSLLCTKEFIGTFILKAVQQKISKQIFSLP